MVSASPQLQQTRQNGKIILVSGSVESRSKSASAGISGHQISSSKKTPAVLNIPADRALNGAVDPLEPQHAFNNPVPKMFRN